MRPEESFYDRTPLQAKSKASSSTIQGSKGSKWARIRAVVKASLRVSKACCVLSVQVKRSEVFLRSAVRGVVILLNE